MRSFDPSIRDERPPPKDPYKLPNIASPFTSPKLFIQLRGRKVGHPGGKSPFKKTNCNQDIFFGIFFYVTTIYMFSLYCELDLVRSQSPPTICICTWAAAAMVPQGAPYSVRAFTAQKNLKVFLHFFTKISHFFILYFAHFLTLCQILNPKNTPRLFSLWNSFWHFSSEDVKQGVWVHCSALGPRTLLPGVQPGQWLDGHLSLRFGRLQDSARNDCLIVRLSAWQIFEYTYIIIHIYRYWQIDSLLRVS